MNNKKNSKLGRPKKDGPTKDKVVSVRMTYATYKKIMSKHKTFKDFIDTSVTKL